MSSFAFPTVDVDDSLMDLASESLNMRHSQNNASSGGSLQRPCQDTSTLDNLDASHFEFVDGSEDGHTESLVSVGPPTPDTISFADSDEYPFTEDVERLESAQASNSDDFELNTPTEATEEDDVDSSLVTVGPGSSPGLSGPSVSDNTAFTRFGSGWREIAAPLSQRSIRKYGRNFAIDGTVIASPTKRRYPIGSSIKVIMMGDADSETIAMSKKIIGEKLARAFEEIFPAPQDEQLASRHEYKTYLSFHSQATTERLIRAGRVPGDYGTYLNFTECVSVLETCVHTSPEQGAMEIITDKGTLYRYQENGGPSWSRLDRDGESSKTQTRRDPDEPPFDLAVFLHTSATMPHNMRLLRNSMVRSRVPIMDLAQSSAGDGSPRLRSMHGQLRMTSPKRRFANVAAGSVSRPLEIDLFAEIPAREIGLHYFYLASQTAKEANFSASIAHSPRTKPAQEKATLLQELWIACKNIGTPMTTPYLLVALGWMSIAILAILVGKYQEWNNASLAQPPVLEPAPPLTIAPTQDPAVLKEPVALTWPRELVLENLLDDLPDARLYFKQASEIFELRKAYLDVRREAIELRERIAKATMDPTNWHKGPVAQAAMEQARAYMETVGNVAERQLHNAEAHIRHMSPILRARRDLAARRLSLFTDRAAHHVSTQGKWVRDTAMPTLARRTRRNAKGIWNRVTCTRGSGFGQPPWCGKKHWSGCKKSPKFHKAGRGKPSKFCRWG